MLLLRSSVVACELGEYCLLQRIYMYKLEFFLVKLSLANTAFITKEDPKSPTKKSYIPIPEIERRRADIDKIPTSHGFLPIVSNCLKDNSQDRPTAAQLCQSLGGLKNTHAYKDDVKVVPFEV